MPKPTTTTPATYGHHVPLAGNAGLDPATYFVQVGVARLDGAALAPEEVAAIGAALAPLAALAPAPAAGKAAAGKTRKGPASKPRKATRATTRKAARRPS
jgi:hypothetical protein